MPSNVFSIDSNIPFLADACNNHGAVHIFSGGELTSESLIDTGCTVLFARSTVKIKEALLKGTKVRFVGTATSGTDHVDKEYLMQQNIAFASALGSNANSVAEYVIWNMLKYSVENKIELTGKTLGIIGYGNIGKLVEKYGTYLKMEVIVNDPPLLEQGHIKQSNHTNIDELIQNSEIITNHVPLEFGGKHPTHHSFNKERISNIKKDALFIHTSRGGVVNEKALLRRINNHEITAVVDVWEGEPDFNTELARNAVFATPHIAGHSFDAKITGAKAILDSYNAFAKCKIQSTELNAEFGKHKVSERNIFQDTITLYKLITESRKLNDDHKYMLNIADMPTDQRKTGFSDYRRNYPIRREVL